MKNPPVPSAGCGKPAGVTTSTAYRTIMSSGDQRQYMITLPANYDMNKPHRIIYASHGQGGEGSDITREKYYGIQNIPAAAESVIFVSASGLGVKVTRDTVAGCGVLDQRWIGWVGR